MTSYSKLAILLNGMVQNLDLSTHELVLDSVKLGGASGTSVTKTIIDGLISNSHASGSDNQNVTAGDGLTGGGSGASPTLAVGAGNGISVSADAVAVKLNGTTLSVDGDGLKLGTVTTDMVQESGTPTNKYFTDGRAQTAAVVNSTSGSETTQAASVSAMKSYVTTQVAAAGTAAEWQTSVLTRLTTPPGSPATGARYLIKATATDDWAGKEDQIAQYSGTAWAYTTCTAGTYVSVDDETDGIYYFGGSSWTKKQFENTTASLGLEKVGADIRLASGAAGNGLGLSSGALSVNVDDTTIGIATDALYVKSVGQLVSDVYVTLTNNTGSAIPAGTVVALSQTTAGEIIVADADAIATCECIAGIVKAEIADAGSGKVQVAGEATVLNGGTSFDLGKRVYVSGTAGQGTKTAPSGTNKVVYCLGGATATNKVLLNMQLVYVDA